ncbi:MAG: lamin tail domain-containing protein [Methanophagales archaeon]|nr:lamin tail domain-containing protein [Methanophagales archaeon]
MSSTKLHITFLRTLFQRRSDGVRKTKENAALKIVFKASLLITLVSLLLFLSPLTLTHEAFAYSSSDNTAPPNLIITEIYPNTATKNELDEYVAITNPCTHPVNIEGWSITDNEGKIIFPTFAIIAPGETIYVTRNAAAFAEQISNVSRKTISPDFEYGTDSNPDVTQLQTEGRFALRDSGDEVLLQDKSGKEVDAVIYGESSYTGAGWQAEPLKKPREGMIYKRNEFQDTNQCKDWLLLTFGASYHAPEKITCFGEVTAFVSPDCSFSVLQREIEIAASSLYINLYQFENLYLLDAVLDALNRGVNVRVLLEGSPVGGIKDEELYIAEKIKEKGGEVRFSHDPFINHAKYAVIDNESTIVMTENWKNTGIPCNNSFGNRGWGVVIRNAEVARYFKEVFFEDFYRGKEVSTRLEDLETKFMSREIPEGSYAPVFEPLTVNSDFTLIPVLAPDTAMSNETILGAINNAEENVYVQQFSTGRFWGEEDNTFIAALIDAAERGCEVKMLLDAKYLEGANNNDEVVLWLNEVAREANWSLEAKLADLDSLGLAKIHNKGLIMDGKKVLITSLNWNANSIYNREAGVIVENDEIASFYEDVFFHDWNKSVEEEEQKENKGDEGGTSLIKIAWVALTLVISFVVFRAVKWYKRM